VAMFGRDEQHSCRSGNRISRGSSDLPDRVLAEASELCRLTIRFLAGAAAKFGDEGIAPGSSRAATARKADRFSGLRLGGAPGGPTGDGG